MTQKQKVTMLLHTQKYRDSLLNDLFKSFKPPCRKIANIAFGKFETYEFLKLLFLCRPHDHLSEVVKRYIIWIAPFLDVAVYVVKI